MVVLIKTVYIYCINLYEYTTEYQANVILYKFIAQIILKFYSSILYVYETQFKISKLKQYINQSLKGINIHSASQPVYQVLILIRTGHH